MDKELFPLVVVPSVPHGAGIRFLHPKQQYDIDNYVEELWKILAQCSGHVSAKKIATSIAKQFSDLTEQMVLDLIEELRSMGVVVDSREAHKHFHQLTENPMYFSRPVSFDDIREYTNSSRYPVTEGRRMLLTTKTSTLMTLQEQRRTVRGFTDDPLAEHEFAQVIMSSYSIDRHLTPSAGGLYPLKLYIIVTRDMGRYSAGYYEFDPESEYLVQLDAEFDRELLEYAFDSDTLLFNAPMIMIIAADMERHSGKYANRGYRYTLIEAGHVAQNIQLAATQAGLGVLEYGGFLDEVLARELGMEFPHIAPIVTLALGQASSQPTFNSMDLLDQLESALVGPSKPIRYVRTSMGVESDNGESFFGAEALYKPSPHRDTKRSYKDRFAAGTATSTGLAQVKAVAEAYERHVSSEVRVDMIARATELSDRWLDPRCIAPWTPEQFATFDFLQPFDPEVEWQWVEGYDQHSCEPVWVPADLVFYPMRTATFGRKLCYEANSSGIAAYTTEAGATERAMLELIERDVVMRNWFKREAPKQIAHNQLPYHWRRRVDYWQSEGRQVFVLDQSDYGVVTINVVIVSDDFPCFVNGTSSSLSSFDEALAKAFHEAELGLIQTRRHAHREIDPERVFGPADHAKLYAHPRHLSNLEWLWSGEETDVIPRPMASMESLVTQFEPVSVRLSPDDSPLFVVRLLSDKLIPISFGFGTEHYSHGTIKKDDIHAESLVLPHYFA